MLSLHSENLLNTRKEEFTITDPNYYSRQKYWEPSGIKINFTYRINQQKDNGEEE